MALRKEKSKVLLKRRESTDIFEGNEPTTTTVSTPIRSNNRSEDEESPYFPCLTQEMRDDVDVLWDYNSPQSKPRTSVIRKSKKKLNLQQSPKIFRRHNSNNNDQIKQDFCKLREELKALKAEIAKPDHEDSLILSPAEEEAFMRTQDEIPIDLIIEEPHSIPHFKTESDEDPFNDDMDDQLIIFSQQVECEFEKNKNKPTVFRSREVSHCRTPTTAYSSRNVPKSNCDFKLSSDSKSYEKFSDKFSNINILSTSKNTLEELKQKDPARNLQDSEEFNDSFDNMVTQMDEDDFEQLTQVADIKQCKNKVISSNTNKILKIFPRSQSEEVIKTGKPQKVSGKVEWHRTHSFESYSSSQLSKEKMQEIERKRLEAKAKLEAKKKQDTAMCTIPEQSDSPFKCSPDEIEKKRLEALKKLEAKRQQEIIEKKKQEAIKRREENRKKAASQNKGSFASRF